RIARDLSPPARDASRGNARAARTLLGGRAAGARRANAGEAAGHGRRVLKDGPGPSRIEVAMLKDLPASIGNGLHGAIPPARYWAYYTWQEIDAIAKSDPNATAVLNIGAVEQHGPHLPLITDTLVGMELLGHALARLPDTTMVLALPPTNFG